MALMTEIKIIAGYYPAYEIKKVLNKYFNVSGDFKVKESGDGYTLFEAQHNSWGESYDKVGKEIYEIVKKYKAIKCDKLTALDFMRVSDFGSEIEQIKNGTFSPSLYVGINVEDTYSKFN